MILKLGLVVGWACAGLCCLATLATGGLWGYASWNDLDATTAAHQLSHEIGLCTTLHDERTGTEESGVAPACSPAAETDDQADQEQNADAPICLPSATDVNRAGAGGSPSSAGSSPTIAEQAGTGDDVVHAASVTADDDTTTANRNKIIRFLADQVIEVRGIPELTASEIEDATGVRLASLPNFSENDIRIEVYQELVRRGIDVEALFGATTCSQLSACSVHRNLAGAKGEELQRYEDEKARDGQTYSDWSAPDFTLPTTDGSTVSLSSYRGHPVLMTLLAGHCAHSLDTLPLLEEIRARYENTDLVVLPVYVNSGSVSDVQSWTSRMDLGFAVAVADGELADAYNSYLVPSTFLIGRDGRVIRRLVGFKDAGALRASVESLAIQ